MITSRKELKEYIKADRVRMPIKYPVLSALTFSESYLIRHYLTVLRHYEYWLNRWEDRRNQSIEKKVIGGGHFYTTGAVFSALETVVFENGNPGIS